LTFLALLVGHHTKSLFCVVAWQEKGANAPKWHYSRLYRASVFIPVVAEPIQDISTVSITDQTVGIGLPRLCGAEQ